MTAPLERKLEVFIGATKRDLHAARDIVINAVLEAGHIPSGMELWQSETIPVRQTVEQKLKRCDVHVVLLGARYGDFISAKDRKSFTQWEYEISENENRPVLAFVIDRDDYQAARKQEIKIDPDEKKKSKSIGAFRRRLLRSRFCREFKNTKAGREQLGRLCVSALNGLLNSEIIDNSRGWIRAESDDATRLQEIRDNPFLQRVFNRLRQFSTLTKRVLESQPEKLAAAQVFWQKMAGKIRRRGYWSLFFESGSTLAYVSQEFEDNVLHNSEDTKRWKVRTNNVECLLQLLLHTDLDIQPLPAAAPDPGDKYGAIFPPEFQLLREEEPTKPRKLHAKKDYDKANGKEVLEGEVEAVDRIRSEVNGIGKKVLVLATTSGLDVSHQRQHFRGPHVGSHPNMLFKRGILTTDHPTVLFLHSTKVGDVFVPGKCFPVFGPDLSWSKTRNDYPMAICVGYPVQDGEDAKENEAERVKAELKRLGFDTSYAEGKVKLKMDGQMKDYGAVIAANERFKIAFR